MELGVVVGAPRAPLSSKMQKICRFSLARCTRRFAVRLRAVIYWPARSDFPYDRWGKERLMRRAVLVAIILYIGAHVLPAYRRGAEPMSGWQVSSQTLQRFFTRPARWILPSGRGMRSPYLFVAWLANPLFWLGVAVLLVGGRAHPRPAGAMAAVAGIAAVACALAYALFLPAGIFGSLIVLPGCYLWIISLALLATIGLHQTF